MASPKKPEPKAASAPKKKAAPKSEAAPAPKKEAPGKVSQIEALVADLVAEPDAGDGVHAHVKNIERAVAGLRDAQQAWKHQTSPPAYTEEVA